MSLSQLMSEKTISGLFDCSYILLLTRLRATLTVCLPVCLSVRVRVMLDLHLIV